MGAGRAVTGRGYGNWSGWSSRKCGREHPGYRLDRELTETLLTGYSAVARRWHQLESLHAHAVQACLDATRALLARLMGD